MKFSVVLIASLLVCSVAAINLRAGGNKFKSAVSPALGNSEIFSQVASLVNEGAPVDDILELLEKIREYTVDEQETADAVHAQQTSDCETNIANRREEIDHYTANIADAEHTIEVKTQAIADKEHEISNKENDISDVLDSISENEAFKARTISARNEEREIFERNVEEHDAAVDAIDEVVAKLEASTLTASLIEGKSTVASDAAQFLEALSSRYTGKVARMVSSKLLVFKSLAKANPRDVSRLLELLDQLKQDLTESKFALIDEDNRSQANFEQQIIDIDAEHEQLTATHNQYESDLELLNAQLGSLNADLSSAEEKLQINSDLLAETEQALADTIADCEAKAAFYAAETERRNEELRIIDECVELVNEKLGTMKDYLKEQDRKSVV